MDQERIQITGQKVSFLDKTILYWEDDMATLCLYSIVRAVPWRLEVGNYQTEFSKVLQNTHPTLSNNNKKSDKINSPIQVVVEVGGEGETEEEKK